MQKAKQQEALGVQKHVRVLEEIVGAPLAVIGGVKRHIEFRFLTGVVLEPDLDAEKRAF